MIFLFSIFELVCVGKLKKKGLKMALVGSSSFGGKVSIKKTYGSNMGLIEKLSLT